MNHRRQLIQAGFGGALLATLGSPHAAAQPVDQVKILFDFPAGSSGDIVCRRVAEKLAGSSSASPPSPELREPSCAFE